MVLYITEDEVTRLLSMKDAIAAVEQAFKHQGAGGFVNPARVRLRFQKGLLHVMAGGLPALRAAGLKVYPSFQGQTRFLYFHVDAETGEIEALIEADMLGRIRTGAASAVATKYMANLASRKVALIGSGRQARTQLLAICEVLKVENVLVYSPNQAHRDQFIQEMREKISAKVEPVQTAETAVNGADIVVTATNSREPVLLGKWLRPGTHLNVMGSNMASRREVDEEAVKRSRVIAVDLKEQALLESGDLLPAIKSGLLSWDQIRELGEIVSGKVAGRFSGEDVTLFKSHGIAIEDVAVGEVVVNQARQRGLGTELPSSWNSKMYS